MGFAKLHGHLAHQHVTVPVKRAVTPNASCAKEGLFKSPKAGATVDSLQTLDIEWDSTCLDTANVDIYVLNPGSKALTPHIWNDIPFTPGKYTLQLQPRWWNATSSQLLQLAMVPAGSPLALASNLPAGPTITATYTPPANGKIPDIANPNISDTNPSSDLKGTSKSLAPGKTAAAVLLPLLLVGGLIFAYLRFQRKRTSQKSQRFSQALDKRMSTINPDWSSVSAAGATAAIRSSMAVGDRSSTAFAFGNIRPTSSASNLAIENSAGVGAQQNMAQIRTGTGVGLRNPAHAAAIAAERASRVSRVSFAQGEHPRTSMATSRVSYAADNTRPSMDSSRRTRAFHQGHVPPVPAMRADVVSAAMSVYPDSEIDPDEKRSGPSSGSGSSPTLSPRQAAGPLTLTPEDIRARMEGGRDEEKGAEMDEVMPALSMMRTGFEPPTPTNPSFSSFGPGMLSMPVPEPFHHTQTADIAESYAYAQALAQEYILPASPPPTHAKLAQPAPPSPFTPAASSTAFSASASMMTASTYAPTAHTPSPTSSAYFPAQPATGPMMMSPDDMLRAYAERQAATATPPPVAYHGTGGSGGSPRGSPLVKGRKLSLRGSWVVGKKEGKEKKEKIVIGHPVLVEQQQQEQQHVIGEDDEEKGDPYVGMAN